MSSIFWIFFIILVITPALRQKMLDTNRYKIIRDIEKKRGSRVISLIHRQESLGVLSLLTRKFIDIEDSEEVLRAIRLTPADMPIDIILHTPGGLVLASEQIANALCSHPAKVTAIVPHYAMSGGTLIALAADEIWMDENAVLGPIDPQIGKWPAASILKVIEQKNLEDIDDEFIALADIAQKALNQMKRVVYGILKTRMNLKASARLANLLTTGKWTHDYPLTCSELQKMGFNIKCNLDKLFYTLMDLYPQTQKGRPSVQYIPQKYEGVTKYDSFS